MLHLHARFVRNDGLAEQKSVITSITLSQKPLSLDRLHFSISARTLGTTSPSGLQELCKTPLKIWSEDRSDGPQMRAATKQVVPQLEQSNSNIKLNIKATGYLSTRVCTHVYAHRRC